MLRDVVQYCDKDNRGELLCHCDNIVTIDIVVSAVYILYCPFYDNYIMCTSHLL